MIDPTKILGSLLGSGMGGGGSLLGKLAGGGGGGLLKQLAGAGGEDGGSLLGKLAGAGGKGVAGLGLLGIAVAALSGLTKSKDKEEPAAAADLNAPPSAPLSPPSMAAAPPPPPSSAIPDTDEAKQAVLLLKAMIAAANADGMIDSQEKDAIQSRMAAANLSQEEQGFIYNELVNPADLNTIVGMVLNRESAEQVYAASILAIKADTVAEHTYLKNLAHMLALSDEDTGKIRQAINQLTGQA